MIFLIARCIRNGFSFQIYIFDLAAKKENPMNQIEAKPPTGLFKIFFNKKGELKRWVILFCTIIIPLGFSIWGICLSIAANNNRESIDALTIMTKKLSEQNQKLSDQLELLRKSVTIAEDQFKATKLPNLKAELYDPSNLGEVSDITVKITNLGGNISNVFLTPLNGTKVSSKTLPKSRVITRGLSCTVNISNLKTGSCLRITFTDDLNNKYSQDLSWELDGEVLAFSLLKEIKK
jgi:hypothetical protein